VNRRPSASSEWSAIDSVGAEPPPQLSYALSMFTSFPSAMPSAFTSAKV
jgi:hypothetical protein